MESLKAASSVAGTLSSSSAELLASLCSLQEQLQAVLPESLPAVLEGQHLGSLPSERLVLSVNSTKHTDLQIANVCFVFHLAVQVGARIFARNCRVAQDDLSGTKRAYDKNPTTDSQLNNSTDK